MFISTPAILLALVATLSQAFAAPAAIAPSANTTMVELDKRNDYCKTHRGESGKFTVAVKKWVELIAEGKTYTGPYAASFIGECTTDALPVNKFEVKSYWGTEDPNKPWPDYNKGIRAHYKCEVVGKPWTDAKWQATFFPGYYTTGLQPAGIKTTCQKL